jgi:hypothetical protein
MPNAQTQQALAANPQAVTGPLISTRVDAAHAMRETATDAAQIPHEQHAIHPAHTQGDSDVAQQLRAQADELAEHLRTRQHDLDHREVQLNARIAQWENELRSSRLWFLEREQKLKEWETQLQQRAVELDERATTFSAAEVSAEQNVAKLHGRLQLSAEELQQRSAALDHAQQNLDGRGRELDERQIQLDEQEKRLAKVASDADNARRALVAETETVLARQQQEQRRLANLDRLLSEHSAQLEADRKQFNREQQLQQQQIAEQQRLVDARQNEHEQELQQKRDALNQRSRLIEERAAAVEQLQNDVTRMHREALELRLITEQLWAQLADVGMPAELSQSLARVRTKLADHYRLASENLTQKKDELQRLGAKLDQQQKKVAQQRQQLQQWVVRRQEELEEQAARLVAREQELERQRRDCHEREQQWAKQRREYQMQLRQQILDSPDLPA